MRSRVLSWVQRTARFHSLVRMFQLSLAVSLMSILLAAPASAAPFVYVVTLSQQFGTIDLANGKFQPIGNGTPDLLTNLVRCPDLLINSVRCEDGSLLTLTTFPTLGSLAKIDPATGAESVIGATGLSFNAFDLAEVRGKLYLTDFGNVPYPQNLYSIDLTTGVAAPNPPSTGVPGDPNIPLTFNSDGTFNLCDEGLYGIAGKLYATFDSFAIDPRQTPPTRTHEYVSPRVYQIDPFTGATEVVANTDWALTAIVEVDGTIYAFRGVTDGFDWDIGLPIGHAELVTLDLKTGKTNKIADLDKSLGAIFGAAPVH